MSVSNDPESGVAEVACMRGAWELENDLGFLVLVGEQKSTVTAQTYPTEPVYLDKRHILELAYLPETKTGQAPFPTPVVVPPTRTPTPTATPTATPTPTTTPEPTPTPIFKIPTIPPLPDLPGACRPKFSGLAGLTGLGNLLLLLAALAFIAVYRRKRR